MRAKQRAREVRNEAPAAGGRVEAAGGSHRGAVRLLVVPVMILALIASTGDSSLAAKRRTRTATRPYVVPRGVAHIQGDLILADTRACAGSAAFGCVTFPTRRRDSHVRLKVKDASNTGPVFAIVAQDLDGDGVFGRGEPRIPFCDASKRMEIPRPGTRVDVFVYEAADAGVAPWGLIVPFPVIPYVHRCADGGIATTGIVKATFSR